MELTTSEQIENLRKALYENQMSLLVGSGFSKNVSKLFPDWNEMLFDLTVELFDNQISAAYEKYLSQTEPEAKLTKDKYYRTEAEKILKREKYLEVVSKYIELKEMPESIITYIEERIPTISFTPDNTIQLTTKEHTELLSTEKLSLHKTVVSLPWNNLFTTNYDDLLDICVDHTLYETLTEEISVLEVEYKNFDLILFEKENDLQKLKVDISRYEEEITNIESLETGKEDSVPGDENKSKYHDNLIKHQKLRQELKEISNQQLETSEDLNTKISARKSCYKLVLKGADLAQNNNKRNLIKLHGTLRNENQRKSFQVGFDGDPKTQYVISKDHYKDYETKHSAFRQLMNVSILRESFCLLGFSGSDPNFLEWVDWVSEALSKHDKGKNCMYLIDMDTKELDATAQLHYAQNRIVRIAIRSPEAINFLQRKTHSEIDPDEYFEVLTSFLKYLSQDIKTDVTVSKKDVLAPSARKTAWQTASFYDTRKPIDPLQLTAIVEKLDELEVNLILPSLDAYDTNTQNTLISFARISLKNNFNDDPQNREKLLKLILYAIKDYHLPIGIVLDHKNILECLENPVTAAMVKPMIERHQILLGKPIPFIDPIPYKSYNQALCLAYTYKFDELKTFLGNWIPAGNEILLKAGLLSLFDRLGAEDLLKKGISQKQNFNAEYSLYLYQMLNYVGSADLGQIDKQVLSIIDNYKKAGIDLVYDNFEGLQKKIQAYPLPLVSAREIPEEPDFWSMKPAEGSSIQYLMLLINSGFQLCIPHRVFTQNKNWLMVVEAGFKFYPEAFLFYGLQYSDEKFLKRIGKLYASANGIATELQKICTNLIQHSRQFPHWFRENTYTFLSEALIAVEPEIWQKDLLIIWKDLLLEANAFSERRSPTSDLFARTITYMDDTEVLLTIIGDCLNPDVFTESAQAISFMYQLNQNQYYKTKLKGIKLPPAISARFDLLIENLTLHFDTNMFVLANLANLLTPKQRGNLTAKLLEVDYSKVKNIRVWRLVIYYSEQNKEVFKMVKKALLKHPRLWYTGITGNTIHGMFDNLNLMNLTKTKLQKRGLTWTKNEVLKLYEKMKFPLAEVARMDHSDDFMQTFTPVLEEMVTFMEEYQSILHIQPDFEQNLVLARKLFYKKRKYEDIHLGLLSKDQGVVNNVLAELNLAVVENRAPQEALNILIYRIMLQVEPEFINSFSYLANWIADSTRFKVFKRFVPQILIILERYKNYEELDATPSSLQHKLVRLAQVLSNNGVENEVINYWIQTGVTSRFNNVKQLLLKTHIN